MPAPTSRPRQHRLTVGGLSFGYLCDTHLETRTHAFLGEGRMESEGNMQNLWWMETKIETKRKLNLKINKWLTVLRTLQDILSPSLLFPYHNCKVDIMYVSYLCLWALSFFIFPLICLSPKYHLLHLTLSWSKKLHMPWHAVLYTSCQLPKSPFFFLNQNSHYSGLIIHVIKHTHSCTYTLYILAQIKGPIIRSEVPPGLACLPPFLLLSSNSNYMTYRF